VSLVLYLSQQADFANDQNFKAASEENGFYVLNSLQKLTKQSQQNLLEFLSVCEGVERVVSLYVANSVIVDISSASVVEKLKQFSEIEMIELNAPFEVKLESNKLDSQQIGDYQSFLQFQNGGASIEKFMQETKQSLAEKINEEAEWNIKHIKAEFAWNNNITGKGLIYGNADTGVLFQHETLLENYYGYVDGTFDHNYAWFDGVKKPLVKRDGPCGIDSVEPCDDNGHGTHTTSTTVGKNGIGVAPGSKWIACRNMDQGFGSPETYLGCLQFFLAPTDLEGNNPRPELRPVAIGNSYGCPSNEGCATHTFTKAVENLRAAGIFMSVSSGNEGPGCSSVGAPPGYEPTVISVGALGFKSNSIAFYSSRGPSYHLGKSNPLMKPDLVAPGSSVKAAFIDRYDKSITNKYASLSGTSMASPHVGGVALLLSEACPCIARNVDALQKVMQDSATKLKAGPFTCGNDKSDAVPNNIYGHGCVNVAKAIITCQELCSK
jgi:subtilisin family serine protease